jgi:hypothetical protein
MAYSCITPPFRRLFPLGHAARRHAGLRASHCPSSFYSFLTTSYENIRQGGVYGKPVAILMPWKKGG